MPPHMKYEGYTVLSLFVIPGCDFVSAEYLENKLMEFDQILHTH